MEENEWMLHKVAKNPVATKIVQSFNDHYCSVSLVLIYDTFGHTTDPFYSTCCFLHVHALLLYCLASFLVDTGPSFVLFPQPLREKAKKKEKKHLFLIQQ